MDLFQKKLILLHHWKGLSWSMTQTIIKNDPTLESFNSFTVVELRHVGVPVQTTKLQDLPLNATLELLNHYQRNGINPITIFDDQYPPLLKEIYQPPWVIFAKGNLQFLKNTKKIAVVGSRNATSYGKMAIQILFPELINQGFIIVSGLATGIDALSHDYAMKLGGNTIGVIAGGFDHIYPKENLILAKEMFENQLIISEYPPGSRPERWHFPLRNRIISGMCLGTLIIEAQRKSGSLITASYAVNEGREVFAVPGNIFSPHSMGTNDLIQQGAKLVKTGADITEEFSFFS
ncbi:DNA-processing protein DprA [Bacillus sp. 1NLA3E]|uniref:DNA-processing protein DprA n=1 Tax=Bacillus sp. 1NLA3E TaxID=666686 RepID=UPI000247E78B|nr:DNA-processing protein DprA [Bacillus sp. 1NLA3E]AGK53070.1 DNA protecting protein DprA [Bacillus sp. 1NLA3E]